MTQLNNMQRYFLSNFVVVALIGTSLSAANRYVDVSSGLDMGNSCLTENSPCKTIGRAIDQANSDDVILIAAGTYVETLTIANKNLTLRGAEAKTTVVDGNGNGPIFHLAVGADYDVTIEKMTLRNGVAASGGAISHDSNEMGHVDLTISDVEIRDNSAEEFGGGIYFSRSGQLTLTNVTISGNTANAGGGILVTLSDGALLTNVTLEGNSTVDGIQDKEGGGIWINSTDFEFKNVTIANNSADGGTGGGIFILDNNAGSLQNTILTNNTGGNCSETLTSNGNNLSDDDTCGFLEETDLEEVDPKLGTLQYKGGSIRTMPLLAESPALNSGNNVTCSDTDARGIDRPQQITCDRGAYEANCGDAIVQGLETCDDGNTTNGDGCSSTCSIEMEGNSGSPASNGCSLNVRSNFQPLLAAVLTMAILGLLLRRFRSRRKA